jgi:hypothetical protein
MKSGLIRRFSVCATALALTLTAANAVGCSTNRPASRSEAGTLMSTLKWHVHRVMSAISSAPYVGDIDASFVAHLVADFEAKNRSAQDRDTRLRHVAEQIADGRTKDLEGLKKVSVGPCEAAKTPR